MSKLRRATWVALTVCLAQLALFFFTLYFWSWVDTDAFRADIVSGKVEIFTRFGEATRPPLNREPYTPYGVMSHRYPHDVSWNFRGGHTIHGKPRYRIPLWFPFMLSVLATGWLLRGDWKKWEAELPFEERTRERRARRRKGKRKRRARA